MDNNLSVQERLLNVINRLKGEHGHSTNLSLAQSLGYTESGFSQLKNGIVPLTDKFLRALKSYDKRVNIDYITEAKGGIFMTDIIKIPIIGVRDAEYYSPDVTSGKVDFVMQVNDNAFAPTYVVGDLLMCKQTNVSELCVGRFYHFSMERTTATLMRLLEVSSDKLTVAIDGTNEMTLTLPKSSVLAAYSVLGFIRYEL